jgi:outer membrane protein OmpA-like peptidoglycan-associated protein
MPVSNLAASTVRARKKTPAGVWVIVGMGLLFAIGGLAAAGYVVWKSLRERQQQSVEQSPATATTGDSAEPAPPSTPLPAPNRQEAAPAAGPDSATTEAPTVGVQNAAPAPLPSPAPGGEAISSGPMVPDAEEANKTRQEVLERIDLMKNLSQNDKDKLYAQVERARGFKKIAILPFDTGRSAPLDAQADQLLAVLKNAEVKSLLDDPTVVVVMVGYADKKGDEAKNLEISRTRAENVLKMVKDRLPIANIMHAVGMGSSDLFDKVELEKNRVVEIWAVQP